jgi:sugar phosphate isomerase/epimerase
VVASPQQHFNMTDHHISRRNFARTTAGLAIGATALPFANSLIAAEKTRPPVGCRDLHLKVAGKPDCWSSMTALGAEVTEVNVELNLTCGNLFHPERKYSLATDDGVKILKDDLAASGKGISAFMMSNHFDERLDQEVECARRLVKAAEQLGVRAIRIDVVPRALKGDEFLPFAIKACKRLCEAAQGAPVKYGVENHSTTANDPAFLEKLFDGVGSPQLGLTLDVGNFYWWGHPLDSLYGIYQKFAPRIVHTHCKNIHYPDDKRNSHREMGWEYAKYNCPIYDGDIDYKRVVEILRKANYPGDLCVEDESLGKFPEAERAEVVRKEIAMLKKLAA